MAGLSLGFCLASGGDGLAYAQSDLERHPACMYCGMNRAQFAHSRMLVTYEDGTEAALCSLHCAAIELVVHVDKTPTLVQVGDYDSKKLIAAEQAAWVLGGDAPGVMTKRGKWAFESKAGAERFVQRQGGRLATYVEMLKAACEDLYEDTQMIREKRKRKRPLPSAAQPAANDKCPVCGMFVSKYPDFLGQVVFKDGAVDFFDGAKDLFKYYFNLQKYQRTRTTADLAAIYVTDYYKLQPIDATQAWYVLGSDVYGPMGKELIPFKEESEAKVFMKDHRGKALLRFQDITYPTVKQLD